MKVKALNSHISQTQQQNEEVIKNILEEKQLVTMYKQVIEELKSQIKIQKTDRDEIKKKLVVGKKNE